jgi:hypothetical protein
MMIDAMSGEANPRCSPQPRESKVMLLFTTAPAGASRTLTIVESVLSNFAYLFRTSAPLAVFLRYATTLARYRTIKRRFAHDEADFREAMKAGHFAHDWFSPKLPFWLYTFKKLAFADQALNILEIGSWEGMSSCFLLRTLPNARLTVVDTWQGGDEHAGLISLPPVEANFDFNTAPYRDRLTKMKGSSASYFATLPPKPQFDLVHVDGSHDSNDVIVDAVQGFARLKVGGIMIFDDYFWWEHEDLQISPAPAINAFLRMKAGKYAFVLVYYQIILKKLAD